MSIIIKTKTVLFPLILVSGLFAATTQAQQDISGLVNAAATASLRSVEHQRRNEYRHPAETLTFFGLQPHMSVLEIWPGRGWYTEILAPLLKEQGHLTIAQFRHNDGSLRDERSVFWARISQKLSERIAEQQDDFGQIDELELDPPTLFTDPIEQFDMVLTFRNAHIWNEGGHLKGTLISLFKSLKPGGILGMVEHRAARLSDISSSASEGYMDEAYVINAAQQAGFELVAASEINANPADTKNYPKGVYALPPTLAMGEQDKAYYMAIGESDRMTLKFIKPL